MQRNFRAAARLIDARWMPRSAAWAWRDLPSARFAIAFSLFLALLAAAFLVGDHVVFDTLQFAVAPQRRLRECVSTFPRGKTDIERVNRNGL